MSCPFDSRERPPPAKEELERIVKYYPRLSDTSCTSDFCQSGRMIHTTEPRVGEDRLASEITLDAVDFLAQLQRDGKITSAEALAARIDEAKLRIRISSRRMLRTVNGIVVSEFGGGLWTQNFQEIEHGVKLCWKHSKRCVMRSEYESIKVIDFRHYMTSKEMAGALVEGMKAAYRQGDITVTAFVFPPRQPGKTGPMIWNNNLLSYAGYRHPEGGILGDASNLALTEAIIELGWKPPKLKTRWDLLPVVTMAEDNSPYIHPILEDSFPSVDISHPDEQHALAFKKLGLRWTCASALSRMGFDIGGVQYTAAPFVAYWLDAEVAVRHLADEHGGYNVLPGVAKALGLLPEDQTLDNMPAYEKLAKLQAAQNELTRAVNWSYRQAKVRMVDTLTASNMYCEFDRQHLAEKGFRLPADPYWLAPPQGSITPLWHRGGAPNYQPKPMLCRHAEDPVKVWKRRKTTNGVEGAAGAPLSRPRNEQSSSAAVLPQPGPEQDSTQRQLQIYYCSAGTTALRLAQRLHLRLKSLCKPAGVTWTVTDPAPLNDLQEVRNSDCILVIASSSGPGEIPENGTGIYKHAGHTSLPTTYYYNAGPGRQSPKPIYAIFGNGNSTYKGDYNVAAWKIDQILQYGHLHRLLPVFQGDTAREDPPLSQFDKWVNSVRFALDLQDEGPQEVCDTAEHEYSGSLYHANIMLPKLARFVHSTSAENGTLRLVQLDTGGVDFPDMGHVKVYVPIEDAQMESLLFILKLTGNEPVYASNTALMSRQVLSLVDLDKPLKHFRWAASVGLQLSDEDKKVLRQRSIRASLESVVLQGVWKKELKHREKLATFISALPIVKRRTFSVASCSRFRRLDNETTLDLVVKIHQNGLFSDKFLSRARHGSPLYICHRPRPGRELVDNFRPVIVFCTGSGMAPLRCLLQARIERHSSRSNTGDDKAARNITILVACRPADKAVIEVMSDDGLWATPRKALVDLELCSWHAPGTRLQDRMFEGASRKLIRRKIVEQEASVFVCASRESADDFAVNLEAIVGVPNIREALGERWIEEVYSH